MMDILTEVKRVFDTEIQEVNRVEESLDHSVVDVIHAINRCTGKVVLCGMGKPGHIAGKISASMSSLGIQSYVLHPGEAMHGDLGTLSDNDIIIVISNSGETAEICSILPNIRMIGTPIAAITSNGSSTLAQYSDYLICLPEMREACALNLAPTSSTTAALVIGDAIAVVVSEMRRFKKENFAMNHPAGALGRKLTTKVEDIMAKGDDVPQILIHSKMEQAIIEMCRTGLGAIIIVDEDNYMQGLITDGDLKRYLQKRIDVYNMDVEEVMTREPIAVSGHMLAADALKIMESREKQLSVLPVLDEENKVSGLIRNHDILKLGIFL